MKKYYSYLTILFTLAIFLFASCSNNAKNEGTSGKTSEKTSDKSKTDFSRQEPMSELLNLDTTGANLIPQDVFMVAAINIDKTIKSTGILENKTILGQIEKDLNKSVTNQNERDKILAIINNHNESGVNTYEPAFLAIYGNIDRPNIILTGTISDQNKFEDFLTTLVTKDSGINNIANSDIKYLKIGKDALLFNSRNFIIGTQYKYSGDNNHISYLASLFNTKKGNSYAATKEFKNLTEKYNGIVNFNISIGKILKNPIYQKTIFKEAYSDPKTAEILNGLNNSELLFSINMLKGKASFDFEFIPNSEEIKKLLDNITYSKKSTGKFLSFVPKNTVLAFSTNFNGKEYFDFLTEIAGKDIVNSSPYIKIFKDLISSVNGDITAHFDGKITEKGQYPEFTVYTETENNSIVNTASSFIPNISSNKSNEWSFNIYSYEKYSYEKTAAAVGTLGFDNSRNTTYFSLSEGPNYNLLKTADTPIDKDGFINNIFYARLNFAPILKSDIMDLISKEFKGGALVAPIIFNEIDYAEIKVEDSYKGSFNLYMKNKDKTPIKTFVDIAAPFLSMK